MDISGPNFQKRQINPQHSVKSKDILNMKFLNKLSEFVGKYMSVIIFAVSILALLAPETCIWIKSSWINNLLMVAMFCMGITLKFDDFKVVFTHPKDIVVGSVAQFTLMPLIAFALGKCFNLDQELMVGVILVGTCPGGTASNIMTFLAKGDVALSVGMTSVNTLLAPILTPAITYILLKESVDVDVFAMFFSILKVVIVPIVLGLIINRFFGKFTAKIIRVLPLISLITVTMILASVVSNNSAKIMSTSALIFVVVILQNCLGYAGGYGAARLFKMDLSKRKAMAIEVGMQNSGLSTSLASTAFPTMTMATVPGAVFSIWHNISGAILANIFRNLKDKKIEK